MSDIKTPEEAKRALIESVVPECQEVTKHFFHCLERRLIKFDPKNYEKQLDGEYIPECMKRFDIETCLKKHGEHKITKI